MSIQCGLPPDLDEILNDSGTSNAGLGHDDATPAEHNVMSDLHNIIETRTGADYRVSHRPSIDGRVGADLDIVFENYATKMGSRQKPGCGRAKSESFLPDPRTGIDVHARAQYRVTQAGVGADPAIPADDNAASNHRTRSDPAARADLRPGLNYTQRADFGGRVDHGTRSDNCRGVNSGGERRNRMEQCCDASPTNMWFG
jgi:hypothetical protein